MVQAVGEGLGFFGLGLGELDAPPQKKQNVIMIVMIVINHELHLGAA